MKLITLPRAPLSPQQSNLAVLVRRGSFPQWMQAIAACVLVFAILFASSFTVAAKPAPFAIWTAGNEADVVTAPRGGIALMGGGPDVDDAFRWILEQSRGGDVVVIRTSGGDAYNNYILGFDDIATPADSVATVLFRTRSAAFDETVLAVVEQAEALFIAGGDQSEYLQFWSDTPLSQVIAERVAEGMTIGGTSAGAMILGEHVYSASHGSVTSRAAMQRPLARQVSLTSSLVNLPELQSVVIDTHVRERNRTGRLVTFLARVARQSSAPVRGLRLDEGTAALIDRDGAASVVGSGNVLLLEATTPPQRLKRKKPLTYRDLTGFRAAPDASFEMTMWDGEEVDAVAVSVTRGRLRFLIETASGS